MSSKNRTDLMIKSDDRGQIYRGSRLTTPDDDDHVSADIITLETDFDETDIEYEKSISSSEKTTKVADDRAIKEIFRNPSQLNMWATTVPQSIINRDMPTRHFPTKRSLRHSRMLVMSQPSVQKHDDDDDTGSGMEGMSSSWLVLDQYFKLACILGTSQLGFGIILLTITIWFFFWSPHVVIGHISHFSVILLCVSGFFIFCFLQISYRFRHNQSRGRIIFADHQKIISHFIFFSGFLSFVSGLFCMYSSVDQIFHLVNLYKNLATCSQSPMSSLESWLSKAVLLIRETPALSCQCGCAHNRLEYIGISCQDVGQVLPLILATLFVLNVAGTSSCLWYSGVICYSCGHQHDSRQILSKNKIKNHQFLDISQEENDIKIPILNSGTFSDRTI